MMIILEFGLVAVAGVDYYGVSDGVDWHYNGVSDGVD